MCLAVRVLEHDREVVRVDAVEDAGVHGRVVQLDLHGLPLFDSTTSRSLAHTLSLDSRIQLIATNHEEPEREERAVAQHALVLVCHVRQYRA